MSAREVNEIASSPRGLTIDPDEPRKPTTEKEEYKEAAKEAVSAAPDAPSRSVDDLTQEVKGTSQHIAEVTKNGKVEFEKPGQKS